jgi:hypothetical protein
MLSGAGTVHAPWKPAKMADDLRRMNELWRWMESSAHWSLGPKFPDNREINRESRVSLKRQAKVPSRVSSETLPNVLRQGQFWSPIIREFFAGYQGFLAERTGIPPVH